MKLEKEKYKKLCLENPTIPLFQRFDWYDAIFDNDCWGVSILDSGNEVIGFLPYYIVVKHNFKLIVIPPLTPYQGIWLKYPDELKYTNQLSFEKEAITTLIEKLPNVDDFRQKFFPSFTNWLPFYWKGYNQTTRYTYIIEDLTDLDRIFDEFRGNIRREIKKAELVLTIENTEKIEDLFQFLLDVFTEKSEKNLISKDLLTRIAEYCKKNNCGEILIAKDTDNQIHSVLFYVWDSESAYYLTGATNSNFKTTGSMSLLLWEAIKRSKDRTKAFNFEGSMIESIERYFRAFGGKQIPYFEIHKNNSILLRWLYKIKPIIGK